MGIDLYVMSDSEECCSQLTAVCRNLASEPDLPELLEEEGCKLFSFVVDEEEGDAPATFDPKVVLVEVDKAQSVCEALEEDQFEFGKEGVLEDLKDLRESVEKAVELDCRIFLDIG